MGGIKHEYILDGAQIVAEKWVENNVEYMMVFLYDDVGSPIGFLYRTSEYARNEYDAYFYEKNFFGDVTAIYNESGSCVARYAYNAWGEHEIWQNTNGIATLNPIRYRGYYYDTHTGLYYLQSRYYNPAWGRFISPDSALYTDGFLGYNLYLYCYNNPVNYYDPTGMFALEAVAGWAGSMWWLTAIDGPIPVGDIIFVVGIIAIAVTCSIVGDDPLDSSAGRPTLLLDEDDSVTEAPQNIGDDKTNDKDSRLHGEPGPVNKEGNKETQIGNDGKATKERHWTDHGSPKHHSNPHDHDITWGPDGKPSFGPPQNYWDGNIPLFP